MEITAPTGFGIKDGEAQEMQRTCILETGGEKKLMLIRHDGSCLELSGFPARPEKGEGIICFTPDIAAEPEEIAADFLKSDSAEEWISYIAVRQFNRMYSLKAGLFVYAERD